MIPSAHRIDSPGGTATEPARPGQFLHHEAVPSPVRLTIQDISPCCPALESPHRDDLLALIGDALLGEALVRGELPADWLEALALMARQTRHAYLRHPWSIHLVQEQGAVGAALAGPTGLRHLEQSLSALSGAPMDARTKLDVLAIVDDYVTGHVIRAAGKTSDAAAAAPGPEAGGNADFIQSQLASGDFPQLATVVGTEDVAGFTDPADLDARFELGLRLLLTGITARFR